jgi:hypothetical protein
MTNLEKLLAMMAAILTFANSLGWTQATVNDEQRLTAIEGMAYALAECDRRPYVATDH